jgi:hypothetical protein
MNNIDNEINEINDRNSIENKTNISKVNYSQLDPNLPNQGVSSGQIDIALAQNQINSNQQPPKKKKNRTLQFYKFLHYAIKLEIKMCELIDVIRFSNQSEISIWIVSLVLYFNAPSSYQNTFVWLHIIHLVRGIIGMIVLLKLPKSYKVVEAMNVSDNEMETKIFNDIARDVIKKEVVDKLQGMRGLLICYFVLTFVNFVFDVIDFFYSLEKINDDTNSSTKAILLTYFMMAFLYVGKIYKILKVNIY